MIGAAAGFAGWTVALLAQQQPGAAASTEGREELFAVLDRFDPLDTSRLPFVRVATGDVHALGDGPWQNTYRHGFLVEATGMQFRVRYLELDSALLEQTAAGTFGARRVGFEPVDLRAFADGLVARLRRPSDANGFETHYRSELPAPPPAWGDPYTALARDDHLHWPDLATLMTAARTFLDGVLAGIEHGRWDPGRWAWR